MARRNTTKSRVELEVKQQEAKNRREFNKIKRWAADVHRSMEKIGNIAKGAAAAIGGFMTGAALAFRQQEKASAQLAASLQKNGKDVERLKAQYTDLAKSMKTTFSDEEILGGAAIAEQMADISEEQMPAVMDAMANWAEFMDTDIRTQAERLGELMALPVESLTFIEELGISIEDGLKDQVEVLVENNRLEQARSLILARINDQIGDVAETAAQTETGGWERLFNIFMDIYQIIGERFLERLKPLRLWLTNVAETLANNRDLVRTLTDWLIRGFIGAITAVIASGFIIFLTRVRVALALLRTGVRLTGLSFRAMWAGATLGLSLLVPFIIENWNAIVSFLGPAIDWVTEKFRAFTAWVRNSYNTIASFIPGLPQWPDPGAGPNAGPQPGADIDPAEMPDIGTTPEDEELAAAAAEAAEEAERLRQEQLERERQEQEERRANRREIEEGITSDQEDEERRRAEQQKKFLKIVEEAERMGAESRIGIFRDLAKAKAAIDKAEKIRQMLSDLATDPTRAFSETYAKWGWPLGAIFGVIAQAATYAGLISGLSSIRSMQVGGIVRADGLHNLHAGELVAPAANFDEVVDAVAAAREGLGGDGTPVVLEVDREVLAETVIEYGRRNRAI